MPVTGSALAVPGESGHRMGPLEFILVRFPDFVKQAFPPPASLQGIGWRWHLPTSVGQWCPLVAATPTQQLCSLPMERGAFGHLGMGERYFWWPGGSRYLMGHTRGPAPGWSEGCIGSRGCGDLREARWEGHWMMSEEWSWRRYSLGGGLTLAEWPTLP